MIADDRPPALPPAQVYKSTGDSKIVLHVDRTCPRLDRATAVRRRRRDQFPDDVPTCSHCAGGFQPAAEGGDGLWQTLEGLDPDDVTGGERA